MWDVQGDQIGLIDCARRMYNDLPEAEQQNLVRQLKLRSLPSTKSVTTYAAWRPRPTTRLVCAIGQVLAPSAPRFMMERAVQRESRTKVEILKVAIQ
jgi:hypothetical protein